MELQDYSGEFKPDLKIEDFSKSALVRLLQVSARNLLGLDGTWHSLVKEKYGYQTAADFSKAVWERKDSPVVLQDLRRVLPAFNIKGDDIATVFKYLQLSQLIGIYWFRHECQLKDKNHGILTVTYCPSLDYFERHGQPELAKLACGMDIPWMQNVAAYVNPDIKVKPLTEVPRKNKDEVPCQWEFTLTK
ncbi:MAG: hypothetical protein HY665_08405 [Chloroflexi bacterium]|nr:hypothetical protein [Chloroflexota bacterium]